MQIRIRCGFVMAKNFLSLQNFNNNKLRIFFIIFLGILIIANNAFAKSFYDIILQKDLFDEKRGANRSSGESFIIAGQEQLGKYQLAGIINIANKIEGAYIKPAPDGKPDSSILLKKGDKLEGWNVEEIKQKEVILKSGEKIYSITLFTPEKGNRKGAPRLGFVSTPPFIPTSAPVSAAQPSSQPENQQPKEPQKQQPQIPQQSERENE